MELIVTGISKN